MRTINRFPQLPQRKKANYFHIRWIFILAFTFGLLPWVVFAYYPAFQEWLDVTFDKSSQMRTGGIILMIGCAVFPVLLWASKKIEI